MNLIYRKDEDINDYIGNSDIKVVYGAKFAKSIIQEKIMAIDFFIDKTFGGRGSCVENIPVITIEELQDIVKKEQKRVLVLICAGIHEKTIHSIFKDLIMSGIEADVFDYFTDQSHFTDKTFFYNGKELNLFENIYNCGYAYTRMTERSIELSLAEEWLKKIEGEVTEVGAVTPYYPLHYGKKVKHIVDPTDEHGGVDIRTSVFDCDLSDKNVLSISTVEHIGTGDYNYSDSHTPADAINKIVSEAKTCMITAPIGYNSVLDDWIPTGINEKRVNIKLLKRGCNNHWEETGIEEISNIEYIYGSGANGIIIIEKVKEDRKQEPKNNKY